VQTCYRRACGSAAGYWGSGNAALALSLRRCGAMVYTSSTVPRFMTGSCPLALSGLGEAFTSKSSVLNFGHLWWQFLPCVTRRTPSPQGPREAPTKGGSYARRGPRPTRPEDGATRERRRSLRPLGPGNCAQSGARCPGPLVTTRGGQSCPGAGRGAAPLSEAAREAPGEEDA
jgi:hypothetical protein